MGRYILEDCDIAGNKEGTMVRNLLTIGTPNMGINELPKAGCHAIKVKEG